MPEKLTCQNDHVFVISKISQTDMFLVTHPGPNI